MAKAGYCASCGTDVWLDEDGCCPSGHPAEDISAVRDAEPVQPLVPEAPAVAEGSTPKPKRRGLFIGIGIAIVVIVLGLCATIALIASPLMKQGAAATDEWKARLAKDYPGWQMAGFNIRTFTGSGGAETEYDFTLIPPGRTFAVGVVYLSQGSGQAVSQDEVLRPGSQYSDRATALLDFIDTTYIKKGRSVTSVTSDSEGAVTVSWLKTTQIGPFSSRVGSYDKLSYDESSGIWSASPGPTP